METHILVLSEIMVILLSNLYLYIELPELVSANNTESWAGYVNGIGFSL